MNSSHKHPRIVIIPLIVIGIAWLGSRFTAMGLDGWYETLVRPDIAPDNAIFGPVWTVLYILITIAALRCWAALRLLIFENLVIALWVANGALNLMWSYLFFVLHDIGAAAIEIWFLNATTLGLIALLWRPQRYSALLLVPYLAWGCFAGYLNYLFFVLNG